MGDKANWVGTTEIDEGNVQHVGTHRFTGGSKFVIADATDATKTMVFNLSGLTTGTETEFTVPESDSSIVTLSATQTLTNKTLTAPNLTAGATDAAIGTVAAPPAGTTAVTIARVGNFFYLTFTLTAARIAVTDDGASGSFGATKLFDFVESGLTFLGCRQNYTAYSPDGTGVPDDDAFVIGIGTTAISAAADAVLAADEQNVGASLAQTLSGGTTTGTKFTGAGTAIDGTATAADLYLNWSGSAATTDGNGTIDVTGTLTVVACLLGDD